MLLAGNTRTPAALLRRLRQSDDLFVRRLASIHPALPLDERVAAALDARAPAWVTRRLAEDPSVPADTRLQLETRLTSADGDPEFDPIACTGSPGASGETADAAYRRFAARDGVTSSLWRSRLSLAAEVRLLDDTTLAALAEDSHAEVRAAAARLSERSKVPIRSRLASVLMVVAALAVLPIGIFLFILAGKAMKESDEAVIPAEVDIGTWLDDSVPVPGSAPLCEAGGTRVWMRTENRDLLVILIVDTDRDVTISLVGQGGTGRQQVTETIEADQVTTFRQPIGDAGALSIAIGANPERPIEQRMGSVFADVGDADADC